MLLLDKHSTIKSNKEINTKKLFKENNHTEKIKNESSENTNIKEANPPTKENIADPMRELNNFCSFHSNSPNRYFALIDSFSKFYVQ